MGIYPVTNANQTYFRVDADADDLDADGGGGTPDTRARDLLASWRAYLARTNGDGSDADGDELAPAIPRWSSELITDVCALQDAPAPAPAATLGWGAPPARVFLDAWFPAARAAAATQPPILSEAHTEIVPVGLRGHFDVELDRNTVEAAVKTRPKSMSKRERHQAEWGRAPPRQTRH
jgi:hypothetical protein